MSNPDLPENYREDLTELRVIAELAYAERKQGRPLGPAMRRHIRDGAGNPELSLVMIEAVKRFADAELANQEALENVRKLSEKTIEFADKVKKFINERPEYIIALKNCVAENAADYWRWSGGAEARRQLAEALDWTVPHLAGEVTEPKVKAQA